MRLKLSLALFVFCGLCSAQTFDGQLKDLFTRLFNQMPLITKETTTIAILPFTLRDAGNDVRAGQCIAEYAVSFVLAQPKFKVVERAALQRVMAEIALSQTGAFSDENTVQAGKLLAVDYFLTGSVGDALGQRLVSARLIRIETGRVEGSATITAPPAAVDDFTQELLGEKIQVSAYMFRSLLAPGWGQFYADHPRHGKVFASLAAVSVGFVTWALINLAGKNSELESFNNSQNVQVNESPAHYTERRRTAEDEKNQAVVFANLTLGITAAVWAVNLIDTYILGESKKERVKTMYFSD